MKRLALSLGLVFAGICLLANLVENQAFTFTQADGTELQLLVSGDEYYHRVHDEQGYTILKEPGTGFAVYAMGSGNSFAASSYRVGKVDPSTLGISPGLTPELSQAQSLAAQNQDNRDAGNRASPLGSLKNIVAYVRFAGDSEFSTTHNFAYYSNFFNLAGGPSLTHYYSAVSNNQLAINTNLFPAANPSGNVVSLLASHARGYYSPYDAYQNPGGYPDPTAGRNRLGNLVQEMLGLLNTVIPDGVNLDGNNDNYVDALTFIFKGGVDNWGDILWPTQWSATSSLGNIHGKDVISFIMDFESGLGLSVICHEMGHMIGAPDLYHYANAPMGSVAPWNGIKPVGQWCLMASDNTQYWLTYLKWKYGTWFNTIPTITPTVNEVTYSLQAIDTSPYACYKIQSSNPNQYYMLEYRRQNGLYDVGVPGTGLIIYRIISDAAGNSQGPPDEVYVYRPSGDVDSNGLPNNASYSAQTLHTEISNLTDPKPWLWENTTTTPNGNLVVYDVGSAGGNTITFKVRSDLIDRWTGLNSTNWNDPGNWTAGVPHVNKDTTIPSGCPRYPILTASSACQNLSMEPGSSLNISDQSLTISQEANIAGQLIMGSSAGSMSIIGNLSCLPGASTLITNNPVISAAQNVTFAAGTSVQMNHGTFQFIGNSNSTLTCFSPVTFYHLKFAKYSSATVTLAAESTADISVYGNLSVDATSGFTCLASRTISVFGNLVAIPGAVLQCSSGTILMDGGSAATITMNPTDYLFNLSIDKNIGSTLSLPASTSLKGSFNLSSGVVSAPALIKIAGNWTNTAGLAAFVEGTGTVEFNGTSHQYFYGAENFNILVVNSGAALRLNNIASTLSCNKYDWTAGGIDVISGTFTANDLVDNGIFGGYWVNPGGVINLHQDSIGWADLNGQFYNYGGAINIWGGQGDCYWAYSAAGGITMTAGTIDWKDRGLNVSGTNVLTLNLSGGTIRCKGNFYSSRAETRFNGGTLELYGSGTSTVTCATSNYFNNLVINKTPSGRAEQQAAFSLSAREHEQPIDYRNEGVNLASEIICHGSLNVLAGTLANQGNAITTWDDIHVHSVLTIASGYVTCGDDFFWFSGSTGTMNVGFIECKGYWRFDTGSAVNLSGSITTLNADYDSSIYCGSPNSWFGNLTLNGSGGGEGSNYALDPLSTNSLKIMNNMVIWGDNGLSLGELSCTIGGVLNLFSSAWINIGDGGSLVVNGNFVHNGVVDIGPGELIVHGAYSTSDTASMTINEGVFRNDSPWRGTPETDQLSSDPDRAVVSLRGAIRMFSGSYEITNNSVNMLTHSTRNWTGGTFRAGVGFSATESGAFQQNGGTLEMMGSNNSALAVSNGNYASKLTINLNPGNTCYLQNDITIKSNLLIASGSLSAGNYAITIGGTWTNNPGPANFMEGTSAITFIGDSPNTGFSTSEMVYKLTINNSSAIADNFELSPAVELIILNDLLISDGTLNMKNNSSLTIGRDISIANGAGLNAGAGTNLNIFVGRNWTDANSSYSAIWGYTRGTSSLCFNGSSATVVSTANSIWDVYHLNLSKTAMVNVQFSKAVRVYGNCNVTNCNWLDSIASLTHQFYGDLTIAANATWAPGNDNTISFRGAAAQSFGNLGTSSIKALTIDKSSGIVTLASTINSANSGALIISSGTLNLNGHLFRSTGNVTIGNGGKLAINADAEFDLASNKTLSVNSGGRLELIGSSGHFARLSHQSGNYNCNIESGATISASLALFEYMGPSGINVKSGATVDPAHAFDNCSFQYGLTGGRLLIIDNNQTVQILNAVFPTNAGTGSANVGKNVDQGTVNMVTATGIFAGENYDQDTFNRVNWIALPQVPTPTITYLQATNKIQLVWTYPVTVTQFRIERSPSPNGPWQSAGTTTIKTWSQILPGTRYFYRVVAEQL